MTTPAPTETIAQPELVYPPAELAESAHIPAQEFERLQDLALKFPDSFWRRVATQELEWFKPFTQVRDWTFPTYRWFADGQLNITHNCLDRHVHAGRGDKLAYIYTNELDQERRLTYRELLEYVCRCANALKSLGLQKGDRVVLYMPIMLEQIAMMLACARLGIIHSVVYAGFSAAALKLRIEDAEARVVITTTATVRKGKRIDLKKVVDEAVQDLPTVEKIIVAQRQDDNLTLSDRELDFASLVESQPTECPAEVLDAEDPLFILYTSGTTGKPKGVVHTQAGYNLFTHYTAKLSFDLREDDIYWCTADTGWITGHSYSVYGPLSNGVTTFIYEGTPIFPDAHRWWSLIEKYKITKFYTAPTVVRLFMKEGEQYPTAHDLSSLKIIGSVGEPINPEAWQWFAKHVGQNRCPVVDTWWQTETGGHMLVTLPSLPQKPGKAGRAFLGVDALVVDDEGQPVSANTTGNLVIRQPWPGALRTCWNNPDRYQKYWKELEPYFLSGDLAQVDEDGYIQVLGRSDDVLKVSGVRIGSAEVESALVSHPSVAEAAVIGVPDQVKGEHIKAFVILKAGFTGSNELLKELRHHVRTVHSHYAEPEEVEFVETLPKTRSGKIVRRILRAETLGQDPGDTSTLEE